MPTSPLLEAIPADTRTALLAEMRRRKFARGEVLFHEGDPGDAMHILERGHVAIRTSTPLGDVATLALLGPGDVFGEQALLTDHARRTASAVALVAAETRSLTRERFHALRREEPTVDRFLVEVLAAQVRRLSAHLLEAHYVDAETRTLRRLAQLAARFDDGDGACIIPLTQDDLATMAGTSRPTANRVLKAAEADQVIAVGRGRVEILDRDELERRAR